MPAGLSKGAQNEWKRTAPELRALGILSGLDRAALHVYCEHVALYRHLQTVLQEEGHILGDKPHPAVRMARETGDRIRQMSSELGMLPTSRAGLSAKRAKEKDHESWLFGDNTGNTGSKRLRVIAGGKDTAK